MKPDINFKDEHTNRNFYNLIIRDKQLTQNSKVSLTTAWIKVYEGVDYFFSKDIYDYTALHYWLVMEHYKVALQILMYCKTIPDFEIPYYINMEGRHEFHDHPLTFFVWKNADAGTKEGSKREKTLIHLLQWTDNDVLLVKNKDGMSAFDYLLQKEHIKKNSSKKSYRQNMIKIISGTKLRLKYMFMLSHASPIKGLNSNLKALIARKLA